MSRPFKTGRLFLALNKPLANILIQQSLEAAFGSKPGSGTISYVYNGNGNLTLRGDARGIQTNYNL